MFTLASPIQESERRKCMEDLSRKEARGMGLPGRTDT